MATTTQGLDASGFSAARNDEADAFIVWGAAASGERGPIAQISEKEANIKVRARTTAAETGQVLDLTALGVTFPAGTIRTLEADVYVSGNAADETGFLRIFGVISGGTTPVVRAVTVQGPSAVAAAGFAATPAAAFALNGNNVVVNVTSAEAEILNWIVEVKVRPLKQLILGV